LNVSQGGKYVEGLFNPKCLINSNAARKLPAADELFTEDENIAAAV
jgi:hypothetical protein